MSFMDPLIRPLTQQGWVESDAIRGCTESEIDNLMNSQGVQHIPETYREFLRYGGRDPYWLSRGGEWDYEWLLEAKDIAREFVVDDYDEDFSPFEEAFIFETHQGYSFYYFRPQDLGESDPEFWVYTATEPVRSIGFPFTRWIRELADYLPTAVKLRGQVNRSSGPN